MLDSGFHSGLWISIPLWVTDYKSCIQPTYFIAPPNSPLPQKSWTPGNTVGNIIELYTQKYFSASCLVITITWDSPKFSRLALGDGFDPIQNKFPTFVFLSGLELDHGKHETGTLPFFWMVKNLQVSGVQIFPTQPIHWFLTGKNSRFWRRRRQNKNQVLKAKVPSVAPRARASAASCFWSAQGLGPWMDMVVIFTHY